MASRVLSAISSAFAFAPAGKIASETAGCGLWEIWDWSQIRPIWNQSCGAASGRPPEAAPFRRSACLLGRVERLGHLSAGGQQPLPVCAPELQHLLQQLHKAPLPIPAPLGKVGPGKNGTCLASMHTVRGQPPSRSWPGRRPIHCVHVRALLPVHLDAHKARIQKLGDLRVLKGLMGHHMAPVAGGIPNAHKNRPVFPLRSQNASGTTGTSPRDYLLCWSKYGDFSCLICSLRHLPFVVW